MGQVFQQFYLYYTFIWGVQLHIDGGGHLNNYSVLNKPYTLNS